MIAKPRKSGGNTTRYVIGAVIVALVILLIYHLWRRNMRSEEDLRDELDDNLVREALAHGLTEEAAELEAARRDDKTKSDGELLTILLSAVVTAVVFGLIGASAASVGGAAIGIGIGALGGAGGAYFGIEALEENRRKVAEIEIRNRLPKFLGGEGPSS